MTDYKPSDDYEYVLNTRTGAEVETAQFWLDAARMLNDHAWAGADALNNTVSASAEEQRAWLAACDRAKAANETLSRAGDIADYGSEQAAQDTRGLAAARYAEVRQVYNHLYDPAHYATIEGDGGKEDAYCDSVWERAESLVDLGYTATSLVGLDAAHAEAEQEAWPVSADQRLADEQHHRGYDDWRTEQTIDELRMQIGAARQDLESGVVPAEREHEHAEHVEYLEEQLAVAEGAPHDAVYPGEGENTTTAQDPDTGHAKDCFGCEHVPGAAHCMTEELNEPWRGNTPAEESSGKPTAADAVQRAHHAATELHARDSTDRIEPASRGEPTSVAASEAVSDGNDQRPLVEVVAEARAAVRELANQEPAREPVAAQVHEEFTVGTADAVVLGDA
ncbi:MAG: hypothetical protein ACRDRD_10545 [Pseudonocardiaceae bacterium]